MSAAGSASQVAKRKNLNILEREEVIRHLLAGSKDGVLKRGAYKTAAEEFGCEWQSIKRLWAKYTLQRQSGVAHPQLANGRKGKSGRKGISIEELRERLRDIPLNDRTTQRRLAAALGVPKSTLHRNLKALGLRAHLGKDKAARAGTPIPRRYPISEESWTKGNAALVAGEATAAGEAQGAAV